MHVFVEANGICDGGGEGFASLAMAMHMCVCVCVFGYGRVQGAEVGV